jgi:amino acid adenylation domain-containing protein
VKTIEFLSYLNSLGIQVFANGERLRINAPKGVLTPELRTELAERKGELLAFLHQVNLANEATSPRILPVARDQNLPLSFAQLRLWFLDQLEPGNATYNMASAYRLSGPLDLTALEQSFNEIVRRHDSFRTTFSVVDGQPRQVIRPALTLPVPVIDLSDLSETEREGQVQQLVLEERKWVFKLDQGPLLRTTLLQLGVQQHVLLLTMHHIISDGWSFGVLFRELAILYEAYASGKLPVLPELAIQYADFAVWQREWLQGEVLDSQLGYWKQQLEGVPHALELPTDRPRSAIQTHRGSTQSIILSKDLSDALKALSRQEGVTLFMTLLAAFKVLLYRYAAQEDIVVGIPIANRNRPEIEGLIGFFINTLVLRTDLSGNPCFRELLARLREVALGAYAHQDLPFEKLVEELQPERDQSRPPLFQVFFNMLNLEDHGLELRGLKVERLAPAEPDSKFDLTLYAREQNAGIDFQLLYNADLFDDVTITQMLDHYQTLLASIVAQPEYPLLRLSLLREDRPQRLSIRSHQVYPTNPFVEFKQEEIEQSIPARFEQQVKQHPQNVALKTRNHEWTYETLNRLANQVAQAILKRCGRGEERIALRFEHDASMIAGLLGVLKAGKTYVPLDPTYPEERLTYILADSQVAAIVTNNLNQALATELAQGSLQLINLEAIEFPLNGEPDLPISPDTLAYILYTSGSTGRPKGVMQSHRNVLHHIRTYTNNLQLNADDKLTLLASYSFDAAVMDIFGALLNGATLYPINIKEEGVGRLAQWLIEQQITIYHSTPTVYRYFVDTLTSQEIFSELRLVVLGGEEVHKQDVELYKTHFPPACIFVNGLGPTESTVSLQCFINHETNITRNTVPIGYPVENTEILLLNKAGEAATVYGEIAIRSPYVALGYWQQPELTEASFLLDPEGGPGRLYRTGDLGRLRPDNSLEFVGRKDFQIKIRGFRIEPGEVEGVLNQHPAVRETTVVAREDVPGNKRLVAYIVPKQPQAPSLAELRTFLQQSLPDYMVPSAFMMLEALPLTPNGKIDHRALPAPEPVRSGLVSAFVAPQDLLELRLTKIWEEVLDVQPVGVRDNFFELGGHSLLAVRLFAQIEEILGRNLPVGLIFQAPTVEQQAGILRREGWSPPETSLVPIRTGGPQRPLFFVPPAGNTVVGFADLIRNLGPDQPCYGLQPPPPNGRQAPFNRVEDLAAHFIKDVRTIQPEGPYLLGGQCFGGQVVFEMAQQLQTQGQETALLVLFDTPYPNPTLSSKIRWHLEVLGQLESKEKLNYVLLKVKRRLAKIIGRVYLKTGRPLPAQVQELATEASVRQASNSYQPQPYQGQITLFRAGGEGLGDGSQNLERGWGEVAAAGVEVHLVPGTHSEIMREPHVQVLAEQLRVCLDQAQAADVDLRNDSNEKVPKMIAETNHT